MKFKRIIIVLLIGAVVLGMLLKYVGIDNFIISFKKTNPIFLILALFLFYFIFLLISIRWKIILSSLKFKENIRYLFFYAIVGKFANFMIPMNGGELVKAYLLKKRSGIPMNKGLSTIVIERTLDAITIILVTLSFTYVMFRSKIPQWIIIPVLVWVTFIIMLVISIFSLQRIQNLLYKFSKKRRYLKIVKFLLLTLRNLRLILKHKTNFFFVIVLTLLIWFGYSLVFYLVVLGTGYHMPFLIVIFVAFIMYLVASIPITPGAVGQIELSGIIMFSLLNIPKTNTVTIILVNQFISYWSFLFIAGIITYCVGVFKFINNIKADNQKIN